MHVAPRISTAVALFVVIASPATIGISAYTLTGDPQFRPLGLTAERLTRIAAPRSELLVEVEVRLASRVSTPEDGAEMARDLKSSIAAKGHSAWVVLLDDPAARDTYVTYRVGSNSFGPFAMREAAAGIQPAVSALRQLRQNKGLPPGEHNPEEIER